MCINICYIFTCIHLYKAIYSIYSSNMYLNLNAQWVKHIYVYM